MNRIRFAVVGLACAACWLLSGSSANVAAQEKLPAHFKVVSIETRPASVELKHPFDYRQLLITGTLATGEKIDLTRLAEFQPLGLVNVSDRGLVRPTVDGKGVLQFAVAGHSGKIPVSVNGQKKPYEVSFVRDIMPTLSKMGCNAGTCHGSAQGKNGFQLSLRGYDPVMDHRSLVDDIGGRRFNRAAPDRSLMLLKPAGGVPHVGGVLTQPGDPNYELMHAWIAQGVKLDLKSPRVTRIEIYPPSPVIPLIGMKQQMTVQAFYSDGSSRDVSAQAFIESSNTEVATVDKQGLVTALRRGETAMLARFEGNYAATPLIVMGDRSGFAWQETPEFNFIDTLVYDKLKQVKIQPSDVCTDADFIRRLHLDLTGLPPEPQMVKAFLNDTRPSKIKREELVDKLVGCDDYVEHWTNKWADLLQVNRKFLGQPGATAFRAYIRDAVAKNKPYDRFVYEMLTASGSNVANPAAAYFKILREPDAAMENTTHLFLAVRFNCNKCHDHPFERWTQNDYYNLTSFFAQIGRKEDPKFKGQKTQGTAVRGPLPLVEIISDTNAGEVVNLRTGSNAQALFPYKHPGMPPAAGPRREQLAKWITSKDNPYFAKSYANRVWSYLLGAGIIEPVDDIRAGNPPTNPKLLDRLTEEFVKSGFNVQELVKVICKSRTYQHSIATNKWNADDDVNYSHALARRLPAEVLFDAIHRATGSQSKLPGLPPGTRAAQLLDSSVPVPGAFLELFGRPPRESACECERTNAMMLGPVLNLVNGPVLADALKDPKNRIATLLSALKDDARVIEELYLAILCRYPTKEEVEIGLQALRGNEEDYAQLVAEKKRREGELAAYEKTLPQMQAQWEKDVQRTPVWTPLDAVTLKSTGGATLTQLPDKAILAAGKNSSPDTYIITANTNLKDITGIRLEVLADGSLPAKGPGRAPNGNFVLTEFKVDFAKLGEKTKPKPVKLTKPQADFSQDGFSVGNAIDNNPATGWAISPKFGENHLAVFEAQNKFGFTEGTTITITLQHQFANKDHNIGKFRISVTTGRPPILLQGATPEAITKILDLPVEKRSPKDKQVVANYYRSIDQELSRLQARLAEISVPPSARALGAQDLAWALLNSPAFLFNH